MKWLTNSWKINAFGWQEAWWKIAGLDVQEQRVSILALAAPEHIAKLTTLLTIGFYWADKTGD